MRGLSTHALAVYQLLADRQPLPVLGQELIDLMDRIGGQADMSSADRLTHFAARRHISDSAPHDTDPAPIAPASPGIPRALGSRLWRLTPTGTLGLLHTLELQAGPFDGLDKRVLMARRAGAKLPDMALLALWTREQAGTTATSTKRLMALLAQPCRASDTHWHPRPTGVRTVLDLEAFGLIEPAVVDATGAAPAGDAQRYSVAFWRLTDAGRGKAAQLAQTLAQAAASRSTDEPPPHADAPAPAAPRIRAQAQPATPGRPAAAGVFGDWGIPVIASERTHSRMQHDDRRSTPPPPRDSRCPRHLAASRRGDWLHWPDGSQCHTTDTTARAAIEARLRARLPA